MKKIWIIILGLGVFATSCKKQLDQPNPNGGTAVPIETARDGAAYAYTGELARISSMLTQQLKGEDIHYEPIYENYILPDNKLTAAYEVSYQHGIAPAVDLGTQEGDFIAGLIYSMTKEYWTNAEKYNGRGVDQTTLNYTDIHAHLDKAIAGTDATLSTLAQVVKARVLMNEGKTSEALTAIQNSGITPGTNYVVDFAGNSTNMNEWQRFFGARGGYLLPDSNITKDFMMGDPRLANYYDNSTGSFLPGFAMAGTMSTIPVGYTEAKFIEAEAKFLLGDAAGAGVAMVEGINGSLTDNGLSPGTVTPGTVSHEEIMKQKYNALFGHPQVLVDYWRTSLPTLTLKNGTFPDQFVYYYQ